MFDDHSNTKKRPWRELAMENRWLMPTLQKIAVAFRILQKAQIWRSSHRRDAIDRKMHFLPPAP